MSETSKLDAIAALVPEENPEKEAETASEPATISTEDAPAQVADVEMSEATVKPEPTVEEQADAKEVGAAERDTENVKGEVRAEFAKDS